MTDEWTLAMQVELEQTRKEVKRLREAMYPADPYGWWCRGCAHAQNILHPDWHDQTPGNRCWVAALGIRFVDVRAAELKALQ